MNCEQALILISAALDGELTEPEKTELEMHLSDCPECRALSEDFGVISVALSGMMEQPPADLIERVNGVLEAEQVPEVVSVKRPVWKRWGSLAAMFAVVVCLGGVFAFSGLNGGRSAADCAAAPQASAPVEAQMEADSTAYGVMEDSDFGEKVKSDSAIESVINGTAEMAPVEIPVAAPAIDDGLTAAEAAELLFDYLGGTECYPDVAWQEDKTGCVLEESQTEERFFREVLRYTGLSEDGWHHTFQIYHEVEDEVFATCTYVGHYAVKLDGSELREELLD